MCVVLKMIMRTNGKTPKLDDLIHQYLIIVVIVTVVIADNKTLFKCPGPSHWKFRAKSECKDTDKYICLFDGNGQKDEEFCGSWPDFENPGYKQILLGGTTIKPCSEDRYQPFIFWTNGSSKCVLKKENCNQEGQVTHSNGTLQTNRICRCDYTNNYDYVFKPKNGCFCLPSEEDCSCYVKSCQSGYILSRDYECLKESKLKYNCPELYRDSADNEIRRTTIISSVEHVTPADSVEWSAVIVTFVCITAILVLFVVYCLRQYRDTFGVSLKSGHMQDEVVRHYIPERNSELQTGMNAFSKNGRTCIIPTDELDLQEKVILKWRQNNLHFEETTASKIVSTKMKSHGFVIISGPPGSGKSAIAYNTAFMLEKDEEYVILQVLHPEEIRKYFMPETKQVFLIDDPVGKYTVDETCIQRWKNEETFIKQAFTDNLNTKLILTCRSYIYNCGFRRKLNISPQHCDLLSHSFKLSSVERTNICNRYNIPELKDDATMLFDCLPLSCIGIARQKDSTVCLIDLFKFLTDEMIHIKESSDIAYLTIALLVVRDNTIDGKLLSLENPIIKDLLIDLCNECGFKYFPSTTMILSALNDLIGTFVEKTDDGFASIHIKLFHNLSFVVGSGIVHCLLKYGSSAFLSNRLQLDSIQKKHDDLVIMVKPEQEELFFERLLLDIRTGNHSHVFTGIQIKHLEFRTKLLNRLKFLKAEDLKRDKYNSTPLHVASEQGYQDLVHVLVELKKDQINHQDSNKRTPLYMACLGGHDKVVTEIHLRDKTTLEMTNDDGYTPLDAASNNGHSSTVKLLLRYGANYKKKDNNMNRTALYRACENGHYDIVKLLLRKKPDIKYTDARGLKAIHIACSTAYLDIVELLLGYKHDKDMINEEDDLGRTPLFIACESNQQNIVDKLLEYNANVNQCNKENTTPLHKACQNRNEIIVGQLLDENAKVNVQSVDGLSPLYIACFEGTLNIVNILLNHKADVNLATKLGWTPLLISCSANHIDICESLQISGANINKADKFEFTPLHIACREKNERIVKFLIKYNAKINARNRQKESPLYISCINESLEIVDLLLRNNADVNLCEEKGNYPLHAACHQGNKQIVQLLLNKKADKYKRNNAGKTPFDVVRGIECDKIVEMLNRDIIGGSFK